MKSSLTVEKNRIGKAFDKAADGYESQAKMQKQVAERLAAALEPWQLTLPPGPVLEVGAGTGFLTSELFRLLPSREFEITDLSRRMVERCRQNVEVPETARATFRTQNAEQFRAREQKFSLVASSFAAQWFSDPPLILGQYAESLLDDGLLLASFPGSDSFPEWREACLDLGLPYTGNPLPDTEEMVIKLSTGPADIDYYEESFPSRWPDALSFFRHLKSIGADTSIRGSRLTPKQFRLLCDHLDRKRGQGALTMTWHLVFIALKRKSPDSE